MRRRFADFAEACACTAGSPWAFALTVALIVIWALAGPFAGWSDTWQLIANTATTIATTLLVLLVQNTQNRDAMAIHAKLDDIITSLPGSNRMVRAERMTVEELKAEVARLQDRIEDASDA